MTATPFTVDIPQADLHDLHRRLDLTRWPDQMDGAGWDYGTDADYLQELVASWQDDFDWRALEQRLNAFPQFRATVDGIDLHFIQQRGAGPSPVPILLLHGWPSSFVQMLDLLPHLTDPGANGGDPTDGFDPVHSDNRLLSPHLSRRLRRLGLGAAGCPDGTPASGQWPSGRPALVGAARLAGGPLDPGTTQRPLPRMGRARDRCRGPAGVLPPAATGVVMPSCFASWKVVTTYSDEASRP